MSRKLRIMIVGMGDVAERIARSVSAKRVDWFALCRSEGARARAENANILSVNGDLDSRMTLLRAANIARSAHAVVYLAPPPNLGSDDPRIKHWLAALGRGKPHRAARVARIRTARGASRNLKPRPLKNVYVSTTGVYGDRAGDHVDETSALRATTARAQRRVAAERRVRSARSHRAAVVRAPGIYAESRLPVERLKERLPALLASEDVYTNHIHANDLAMIVWRAMFCAAAPRVYNAVDDADLKMGEYLDLVADSLSLPRAPRMTRGELAKHVTPMMLSFMSESRRIGNARMKEELKIRLRYPTPQSMLASMNLETALQRTLI